MEGVAAAGRLPSSPRARNRGHGDPPRPPKKNGDKLSSYSDQDAADLWEIDENFARSELTDAQRAEHHVRREDILKRKGLVSAHGGARKQDDKLSSCSYADQAAASLGVDKRTVQRDLARGKKIDADVLAQVSGTDMDKGVVLDELARTPKDDQRAKLAEITLRRPASRLRRSCRE